MTGHTHGLDLGIGPDDRQRRADMYGRLVAEVYELRQNLTACHRYVERRTDKIAELRVEIVELRAKIAELS